MVSSGSIGGRGRSGARAADSVDRRQSVLTLTAEGLRALERDMAERDAWLAEALGTLSETEREVLRLAGR